MQFAREPKWDLSYAEMIALQRDLASRVRTVDRFGAVDVVAGVDMAVGRATELGRAAVVVWRMSDGAVLERVAVELPITIPYIPGLLAFREGPLVEAALRKVQSEPDLVLVDGQGIAHPRRLGIAAHLGVLLDRPTVGVGKSRLTGRAEEPGPNPGDRTPLLASNGELIGMLLRTRARSKPVYVSPGQDVSVESAADLVMRCCRGHRLPEPLHLADRYSKERRERESGNGE